MRCPHCHFALNEVVKKKMRDWVDWRRRRCLRCKRRFSTYERVAPKKTKRAKTQPQVAR